ncbi:MAG: hypothetical protein ACRYGR_03285 [Janthinobacterium lividum]
MKTRNTKIFSVFLLSSSLLSLSSNYAFSADFSTFFSQFNNTQVKKKPTSVQSVNSQDPFAAFFGNFNAAPASAPSTPQPVAGQNPFAAFFGNVNAAPASAPSAPQPVAEQNPFAAFFGNVNAAPASAPSAPQPAAGQNPFAAFFGNFNAAPASAPSTPQPVAGQNPFAAFFGNVNAAPASAPSAPQPVAEQNPFAAFFGNFNAATKPIVVAQKNRAPQPILYHLPTPRYFPTPRYLPSPKTELDPIAEDLKRKFIAREKFRKVRAFDTTVFDETQYNTFFPEICGHLHNLRGSIKWRLNNLVDGALKADTPSRIIFGNFIRDEDENYLVYDKTLQHIYGTNDIADGEHLGGDLYMIPYENRENETPSGAIVMGIVQNNITDDSSEPIVKADLLIEPMNEIEIIGRHYMKDNQAFVIYKEDDNGFLNIGRKFKLEDNKSQEEGFSIIPYNNAIAVKNGTDISVENLVEREWVKLKMIFQDEKEYDDGTRGYKVKNVECIPTQDLHGREYEKFIKKTYKEARDHNFGEILNPNYGLDSDDDIESTTPRSSIVQSSNLDDDI